MRTNLLLLTFYFSLSTFAQSKILYTYDAAGNRIRREMAVAKAHSLSPKKVAAQSLHQIRCKKDGHIRVELPPSTKLQSGTFTIYNINGVQQMSSSYSGKLIDIDMTHYGQGTYILKVDAENERYSWKILR